jgi:hypothetical protein
VNRPNGFLFTNFWLTKIGEMNYELSVDDKVRVKSQTDQSQALQGEFVVEYERAFGVVGDEARLAATKELTERHFSVFPKDKIMKLDYIVTYQLDYVFSCRQRDNGEPRQHPAFSKEMLRFVREHTGVEDKDARDVTSLDIADVEPSQKMKDAFIALYPCSPPEQRDALTGRFLVALTTQLLVYDAAIRFLSYAQTATNALIRETVTRIQKLTEAASVSTVRDRSGHTTMRPAFEVHRAVSDIFNDLTASEAAAAASKKAPKQVRMRVASISLGDTVIASGTSRDWFSVLFSH